MRDRLWDEHLARTIRQADQITLSNVENVLLQVEVNDSIAVDVVKTLIQEVRCPLGYYHEILEDIREMQDGKLSTTFSQIFNPDTWNIIARRINDIHDSEMWRYDAAVRMMPHSVPHEM